MDASQLKCGAIIYPSNVIYQPKGNILHGIKCSDPGFMNFGEAYFSYVRYKEIKGWKKHTRMIMNLLVPIGTIRFHLHAEDDSVVEYVDIGELNYSRLMVPPGVWMAFEGVGNSENMLMNLASIVHDPGESVTKDFVK